MDIKEIQHLIKFVAKSGASEVKLEMEDVKIPSKQVKESKSQKRQLYKLSQQQLLLRHPQW